MALPSPHFNPTQVQEKLHVQATNKIDRPPPARFVAFCKFCREGFPNDNELFQHRKTHEKCPYDDCKFNASGKAVAEHITRVHLKSNTLVKIQDLITPEQIEKWREERRKRYPTSSNIALRQQAQEDRMQRGEKLQERNQRFGDFKQRNHIKNFDNKHNNQKPFQRNPRFEKGNQNNRQRFHKDRQSSIVKQDEKETPELKPEKSVYHSSKMPQEGKTVRILDKPSTVPINDDSSDDDNRPTPKFKGTSQMKDYHQVETLVKEKAALSILGMYGSDSEEEVSSASQETEEPVELSTVEAEEEKLNEPLEEGELEGEAPDEVPIDHQTAPQEPNESTTEKYQRKRKHEGSRSNVTAKRTVLDYGKLRTKPSVNPFLEKLLQDDIRHERNVLLQCVNFVVKNNFFNVGKTNDEDENSSQ